MHAREQLVHHLHHGTLSGFFTQAIDLDGDHLDAASHFANASGRPEAMTVISPDAALAAPPDTGPSIIINPAASRRFPSTLANSGDTVALAITTDPGAMDRVAPSSPKSTDSV